MVSFNIFKKHNKRAISRGSIIKYLALFFISLFLLSGIFNSKIELTDWQKVFGICGVCLFLLGLILKFYGMFNYESLNGEFKGFLEFNNQGISVDGKIYEVGNIKNIEINNEDYKGKLKLKSRLDFDNALSNGVDNFIRFSIDNLDNNVEVYFQQNEKFELKIAEDFLVKYFQSGKIGFLKLIDILGIVDYHEIQNFKKKHNINVK
jgi:hypothetical protein